MARTRVRLKELRDAEIRYVSLVDRAATRMPFRVLKQDKESDMIDLTKPGQLVARVLKSAGFNKEEKTMDKDTKQACAMPAGMDKAKWDAMTPADQEKMVAAKKVEDDAAAAKKVEDDAAAAKKVEDDAAAKKLADDEVAAKKVADDAAAKKVEEDAAAKKVEEDAAAKKAAEAVSFAALIDSIKALGVQFQELTTKVETSTADMNKRVDEIARKSDDALAAVKTTVIGGKPAGDEPSGDGLVKKAEDTDPRSGTFDTAYIRLAQKRDKRTAR